MTEAPLHTNVSIISNNFFADETVKKAWWKQAAIRRCASSVQAELEAAIKESPFLQQPLSVSLPLAYFDRSEIRTSRVVGKGGFSIVSEIVGFELNSTLSAELHPEYQKLREEMAKNAIDPETGRGRYALKHLRPELVDISVREFSRAASDLAAEAAYLSRLNHPNVVSLRGLPVLGLKGLESGQTDGLFLVLDRLEDTLDSKIKQWKQDAELGIDIYSAEMYQEKTYYAKQLAEALCYLHEHGIVFRDLKPQNIGFAPTGELQLLDFGLCRAIPSPGLNNNNKVYRMSGVGTRRYMAPEVVRDRMYNLKVDVYGWAVITWEMFTLRQPYNGLSIDEHSNQVCVWGGDRPDLRITRPGLKDPLLPVHMQLLLADAWDDSLDRRPSMVEVLYRLLNDFDQYVVLMTEDTAMEDEFMGVCAELDLSKAIQFLFGSQTTASSMELPCIRPKKRLSTFNSLTLPALTASFSDDSTL